MFKKIVFIFLLITSCALRAEDIGYVPSSGYVPDAETAIKIAVAVWEPIYGKEKIKKQKPYKVSFSEGVWIVTGSLKKGRTGGVALIKIAKNDGRILYVIHGK